METVPPAKEGAKLEDKPGAWSEAVLTLPLLHCVPLGNL